MPSSTGSNALVDGPSLYATPPLFATVCPQPGRAGRCAGEAPAPAKRGSRALNRGLLDDSFPVALGVAALAVADATVRSPGSPSSAGLPRTACRPATRSSAGFTAVDDTQDGCVRFSAYAGGSASPASTSR